jgi:Rrf2 family protein
MISQSAEYSLRALLCLAAQHAAAAPPLALTTRQIAQRSGVPAGYLAKLLQAVGRAGLVSSQRGVNGGFVLSRDPARITLLDVVSAVELSRRIKACPLGVPAHRHHLCPLHRRLDDAAAGVEAILRTTTLADVLAEAGAGVDGGGLCPHSEEPCMVEPVRGRKEGPSPSMESGAIAPALLRMST